MEHTNAEGHVTHVAKERGDRFLPVSILIAGVVIGGSLVFSTLYGGGGGGAGNGDGGQNGGTGGQQVAGLGTPAPIDSRDMVVGDAKAKVTVIEYGDYQCPFCAKFFTNIESQIIEKYVKTGKVRFVFRGFSFLGPESTAAAEAAACAVDQNKGFAYHDALYAAKAVDFNGGAGEGNGFFNRTLFLKLAQQVGLDVPTFTSCIDTHKNASVVDAENAAAQKAGVNSTPTTFVNGKAVVGPNGSSVGADANAIMAAIAAAVGN